MTEYQNVGQEKNFPCLGDVLMKKLFVIKKYFNLFVTVLRERKLSMKEQGGGWRDFVQVTKLFGNLSIDHEIILRFFDRTENISTSLLT